MEAVLRWEDAATGRMTDLPHARGGAAHAIWRFASQELLYLFGGCSVVQCFDGLQRLDLRSGQWATEQVKGTPPKKRKGATLNLLGRKIEEQILLVFGGWSLDGAAVSLRCACAFVEPRVLPYGIAPSASVRPVATTHRTGPVPNSLKEYSIQHNAWESRAYQGTPPSDRWGHSATSIDDTHVIVFGGESITPGRYLNDVYIYSMDSGEWRHVRPRGDERTNMEGLVPSGRMGHSATLVSTASSRAVYFFGGYRMESRGSRVHRIATNELWALDLRGGVGVQRHESPASDHIRWVRIDTVGRPPAARGHHAAVVSNAGGNLFVAFGCDATEYTCYNDVFMLDTTYPQGHRWHELPVGMQRPAPRHMLSAWAHASSLYVSGGCAPARDAASDHCFSDVWSLHLEGVMDGGKQLNATLVEEDDSRLRLHHVARERASLSTATTLDRWRGSSSSTALPGHSAALTTPAEVGNGAVGRADSTGKALGSTPANTTLLSASMNVSNRSAAEIGIDGAPALFVDTSLNDGVDVISAAVIQQGPEALCQMSNLSRCESAILAVTAGAGSKSIELSDTTRFAIGRFIRINPGEPTQEDAQIRGFGDRVLNDRQRNLLALARARAAAEGAKEASPEMDPSDAADASVDGDILQAAPPNVRLSTAFLQLRSRAGAILPEVFTRQLARLPSLRGSRAEPPTPRAQAIGVGKGNIAWDSSISAREDPHVPYEASLRVHGRSLMRFVNLSMPLRFGHSKDEIIVQLPTSYTALQPVPGLQHIQGDRSVHRQDEFVHTSEDGEDGSSPVALLQRARRRSPPPSPPLPPPSPPSPPLSPPPTRDVFVEEDVQYMYDGGTTGHNTTSGKRSLKALAAVMRQHAVRVTSNHTGVVAVADSLLPHVYLALACVGSLCLVACVVWSVTRRRESRRRRAALEDINPVFQTETWRKLE